MKRLITVVLLLAACSGDSREQTATMQPAEPRPAPPITGSIGEHPEVTTAGSPPPRVRVASGTEVVTVGRDRIEVRPLLPRASTAFHLRNTSDLPHQITLRGGGIAATAALAPRGGAVLQGDVQGGVYELTCDLPGHSERARFETYVPGVDLRKRGGSREER